MIKKAHMYTRAEAWSQGSSHSNSGAQVFTRNFGVNNTCRNWSVNNTCSWEWAHHRRMSDSIFGYLPRSWRNRI